jgi:hypothetical protein
MKRTLLIFILIFLFLNSLFSGEKDKQNKLSYLELKEKFRENPASGWFEPKFDLSGRKVTGLIYSAVIPGTGQYYLGHQYKGAAITILAASSIVLGLVSQNNVVAMNEKLESLEYDYSKAGTYSKANDVWLEMLTCKADADDYKKNRNLAYGIFAGVWALNILDLLFLTPDRGSVDFSHKADDPYILGLGSVFESPTLSLQINF